MDQSFDSVKLWKRGLSTDRYAFPGIKQSARVKLTD